MNMVSRLESWKNRIETIEDEINSFTAPSDQGVLLYDNDVGSKLGEASKMIDELMTLEVLKMFVHKFKNDKWFISAGIGKDGIYVYTNGKKEQVCPNMPNDLYGITLFYKDIGGFSAY